MGPLAAAKVDEELASEDGRDMLGEQDPAAALVPVWGEDELPPSGAAAPKPPPPPREQSVEEILHSERPHPPQSTDTPWTVEVVARARGHWNVDPMSYMPGATVRGRQKGLELHGPFHFSSDSAAERQRAISLTRDTGPREPPGYVPVPRLSPRMRVERPGVSAAKWAGPGLDLYSRKPPPCAADDSALLQDFRTPFVDAAAREEALGRAARDRSREVQATNNLPMQSPRELLAAAALLSPRRPLPQGANVSPRGIRLAAITAAAAEVHEGLDDLEIANAKLMLGGGLRFGGRPSARREIALDRRSRFAF